MGWKGEGEGKERLPFSEGGAKKEGKNSQSLSNEGEGKRFTWETAQRGKGFRTGGDPQEKRVRRVSLRVKRGFSTIEKGGGEKGILPSNRVKGGGNHFLSKASCVCQCQERKGEKKKVLTTISRRDEEKLSRESNLNQEKRKERGVYLIVALAEISSREKENA